MKFSTGLFFISACIWSVACGAQSDCAIGLRLSTTVPTIDGYEGVEWSDANTSVLDSSSPCFEQLRDLAADGSYPTRPVTVKSKRYQRGTSWYLGFLFEVRDFTSSGPCGGAVCIGEKIVMQFNRTINGDTKLDAGQDKRFTITHRWAGTGDAVNGTLEVAPSVTDSICTPVSGVDTQWGTPGTGGITFSIRKGITGGGYRAEIEVPISFIGPAADLPLDIGVGFAVVNDFGTDDLGIPNWNCTATGTCDAAAASFPGSLPETNDENPVDALCDKGWVVPRQWGVGYLNNPPAQVTISRMPQWWNSDAIRVFECDSPGYTYYRTTPCRARIEAVLNNSGATTRRNVVFLWAKHGTGDPTEYNFVDFKRDVVIAQGIPTALSSTTVSSVLWSGMPRNEANHPCLRVYTFPDTLSAAHENVLRGASSGGVVTKASLDSVVAAYAVQEQHWAQKNISRHSSITQCPNPGCRVSSLGPLRIDIVASAWAQPGATTSPGGGVVVGPGPGPVIPPPTGELERYAKDHVIVQARTVAFRVPTGKGKPLYNFVEDFGGVAQLVPMTMVNENRVLPLEFQVSNGTASTMRVRLITQTHMPAGTSGVKVSFSTRDLTLQPRSVATVKGTVENANIKTSDRICQSLKFSGVPGGLLAFGGVAVWWWSRRRK